MPMTDGYYEGYNLLTLKRTTFIWVTAKKTFTLQAKIIVNYGTARRCI